PALVQRWLLGPDGWTMPVCEIDLRVGGSYRYVWSHAQQGTMGVGGVYREIKKPSRIVQTEKFDQAWYPGEALQTLELKKEGSMTWMTATALFETKEARDAALNSNMEKGMVPSYDRLDEIAEQNAKAAS
ncbi:MAG TPA: SRPBCC domain-containing protein, partial [Leptospiraceae bacterium]|nr:SRPBCC domain-containing protein [Leptospiraceae bacterium]